jgi:hypothetical protein
MNSAPAELLQLLTIGALQPSPPISRPATFGTSQDALRNKPEKKKPPCLN